VLYTYLTAVSMWAALEPLSTTADAGGESIVSLRIRNTGEVVDEYHVDAVGGPALWCTIEPTSIRLYPGTTGSVRLIFRPPRSPEATAGPNVYGVRVTPTEHPDAVTVLEGNLTVAPFTEVRAELLPPTVRGWWHAKPRLAVDNFGNTRATAAVLASSQGNQIGFDIRTPSLQVEPGRAHFSTLRIRPERRLWLGQKVSHPYTATVQLSGGKPVTMSGTYLQNALLPRWMGRLAMLLGTLAVAALALWFMKKPVVTLTASPEAPVSASSTPITLPTANPPGSAGPTIPAAGPGDASTTSAEAGSTSHDSGGSVPQAAPPAPAVQPIFNETVGPGCTKSGIQPAYFFQVNTANNGHGTGWLTQNTNANDGSPCDLKIYDSMPMDNEPYGAPDSGPNRGEWLFDLPSAISATCTIQIYIPRPPAGESYLVGGKQAYYTVDEGTVSTTTDITTQKSDFTVDQTAYLGSHYTKEGISINEQYIAVRLDDQGTFTGNPTNMFGVGGVSFVCYAD
jgi:hypothetical protein